MAVYRPKTPKSLITRNHDDTSSNHQDDRSSHPDDDRSTTKTAPAVKQARGSGDRVGIAVRLDHARWKTWTAYAQDHNLSLNQLIIDAVDAKMRSDGLL